MPVLPMRLFLSRLRNLIVIRRSEPWRAAVLRQDEQWGGALRGPSFWWCRRGSPEELAAFFGPSLPALGQSVLLLIGHGAALRELCCQRIGRLVKGRGGRVLVFVVTQANCAGRDDQDEEHHGCHHRQPIERCLLHQ